MANELRFSVVVDDAGAIVKFKNLKTAATSAGSGISSGFGSAGGALSKVEKGLGGVGTALGHAKSQIGGLLGSVGLLAGGAGMFGLSSVLSSSVNQARDFGAAMELIKTQTGGTQQEVDSMSAALLNMAKSVGTTPDQLAAGLYHVESAGLRGAKALDVLKVAAEGAKVGGADMEAVTNALVAANQSGVKGVESMTGAMGSLNAIVGAGNMRMQDLVDAMGTGVLSTAKNYGVTLQSIGASLASMTDQGIPAIDAATRLNSAMRLMAAPTKAAVKELGSIGLTSKTLAMDMRSPGGMLTAITDLKSHLDKSGLSLTDQAALIAHAFGGKQSGAILTLIGNVDLLKQKTDAVAKGAGAFGDAWNSTTQNAQFAFDQFNSTISSVAIKIGTKVLPEIVTGLQGVSSWLDTHGDELAASFKGALDTGIKLAGVAGDVIGKIATVWNSIPSQARDLLIEAFVGNKIIKWTFGIDIMGSVAGALAKNLPGVLGNLFKNATTAAMSVEAGVVNVVGGTGLPGVPPVVPPVVPGGGGGGPLGFVKTLFGGFLGGGAAVYLTGDQVKQAWARSDAYLRAHAPAGSSINPLAPSSSGGTGGNVGQDAYGVRGGLRAVNQLSGGLSAQLAGGRVGETAAGLAASITKVFADSTGPSLKSMGSALLQLKALQTKYLAQGDVKLAAAIGKDITYLSGRVDLVTAEVKAKQFTVSGGAGAPNVNAATGFSVGPVKSPKISSQTGFVTGAQGMLGKVSSTTHMIVGEAGNETVAVLRNARSAPAVATGGLTVNVNLASATGIITPGAARQIMGELGPLLTAWLQRQGILPRLGTPLRG